jgi:hypothetical protein
VWALHGYQRSPCHHVVHRATVTQTRDGVDSGVLRGSSGGARDARHHTRPAEGSATLRTARSRRGQRAGALLARLTRLEAELRLLVDGASLTVSFNRTRPPRVLEGGRLRLRHVAQNEQGALGAVAADVRAYSAVGWRYGLGGSWVGVGSGRWAVVEDI